MSRSKSEDLSLIDRLRIELRTNQTLRERIRLVAAVSVMVVVLSWLLLPLVWTFMTSLKARTVATAYPPVFYGFDVQWGNYAYVLTETALPSYIKNGLIMSTAATAISLVLGIPHAYAVGMYESRIGDISLTGVIAGRIIPPLAILVPFYAVFSSLGLIDTLIALIIVETAMLEPFVVWITAAYYENYSQSMIDSARIDGCSHFQAFYKIMIPVASDGIASATIIAWLLGWNAFSVPFILATTPKAQTLPVGIFNYATDLFIPWNLVSAAAMVGLIPTVIIVLVFQNYLVKGMVRSETA